MQRGTNREETLGPGSRLGDRYQLHREVGRGASAQVFEAFDEWEGTRVAVKVLGAPAIMTGDERARISEAIAREWRAGSRLDHALVVRMLAVGRVEGRPYLVMEYVAGDTLASRLSEWGAPAPEHGSAIIADILSALAHAHAMGVIHRDVKPSNVIIGGDGRARLADFGIATVVETLGGPQTQTSFKATPAYMSPEQACGERIDHRTDLFSTGVVAFECFTGRRPYRGNHAALVHQIARQPLPPTPEIGGGLRAWLERACAKDPAERFPSADVMRRELVELAGPGSTLAGQVAETVDGIPARVGGGQRRRWLVASGVVVMAVTLGMLLLLWQRRAAPAARDVAAVSAQAMIGLDRAGVSDSLASPIHDFAIPPPVESRWTGAAPVPPRKPERRLPRRRVVDPGPPREQAILPPPPFEPVDEEIRPLQDPRARAMLDRMVMALGGADRVDALHDLRARIEVHGGKGRFWKRYALDRDVAVLLPDYLEERTTFVRRITRPEGVYVDVLDIVDDEREELDPAVQLSHVRRSPLNVAQRRARALVAVAAGDGGAALDVTVDRLEVRFELDEVSGLPLGSEYREWVGGRPAPVTVRYLKWREAAGVMLPVSVQVAVDGGRPYLLSITDVSTNVGLTPEDFWP